MAELPPMIAEDPTFYNWSGWQTISEQQTANIQKSGDLNKLVAMIGNPDMRAFVLYCLSFASDKFWTTASSTSGKYHNASQNGEGGLIRHIYHVGCFAAEGIRRYNAEKAINSRLRDIVFFSVLMHDWAKQGSPITGWGPHTIKTHGELAADIIKTIMLPNFLSLFPEIRNSAELVAQAEEACTAIHNHYGIWGGSKKTPDDPGLARADRILQEADYYSTRSFITEFDEDKMVKSFAYVAPACADADYKEKNAPTPDEEIVAAVEPEPPPAEEPKEVVVEAKDEELDWFN